MSTLSSASVRRCRNRFFGATLYQLSGASSRTEYARWCDHLDRPQLFTAPGTVGGASVGTNPKWLRLLDAGVQLHEHCLNHLMDVFPELKAVYNHPLWEVLGWDSNDRQLTAMYLATRRPHCVALQGSSYPCRVNARMRWALGVPDWTLVVLPLALFRNPIPPVSPQQRWLQQRFSHYVALASLMPAYHQCFNDLWALLDCWLKCSGQLFPLAWAADAEQFEYQREFWQISRDEMIDYGWLPPSNHPTRCDLAMLWCICLASPFLADRLNQSLSRGVRRCPPLLRQLMRELDPRLDVLATVSLDQMPRS